MTLIARWPLSAVQAEFSRYRMLFIESESLSKRKTFKFSAGF
jgi:hypothetical protein